MDLQEWLTKNRYSHRVFAEDLEEFDNLEPISRQAVTHWCSGGIPRDGALEAIYEFTSKKVGPKDWGLPKNYLNRGV